MFGLKNVFGKGFTIKDVVSFIPPKQLDKLYTGIIDGIKLHQQENGGKLLYAASLSDTGEYIIIRTFKIDDENRLKQIKELPVHSLLELLEYFKNAETDTHKLIDQNELNNE